MSLANVRVLIKGWSRLHELENDQWEYTVTIGMYEGGSEWSADCLFTADKDANSNQIRSLLATAVRDCALREVGGTVPANGIILPDCTRI